MDVETIDRPKAVTAPPKRWRNKWSCKVAGVYCGFDYFPGEWHWCTLVFPSKDLAETHAEKELEDPITAAHWRYDGAFPDDAA